MSSLCALKRRWVGKGIHLSQVARKRQICRDTIGVGGVVEALGSGKWRRGWKRRRGGGSMGEEGGEGIGDDVIYAAV